MKKILFFLSAIVLSNKAICDEDLKLKDFKVEVSNCTAKTLDVSSLMDRYEPSIALMKKQIGTEPDFAGHYYLVDLPSAKGGYVTYAVIDCLTGKQVASLDDAYAEFDGSANQNGYRTRRLPTSRLLVLEGFVRDKSQATIKKYESEYYEMKDGKLTLLKKLPAKILK